MIINNKIILGIDPGTVVMGYAVIEVCGDRVSIASMDVLKLGGTKDIYARLEMIHSKVNALISQHQPNTFAIEAPFFGKNVQSMLKLGRAQGVCNCSGNAMPCCGYRILTKKSKAIDYR
jgi:crossover junction endodeoxyribonuclease RuvC